VILHPLTFRHAYIPFFLKTNLSPKWIFPAFFRTLIFPQKTSAHPKASPSRSRLWPALPPTSLPRGVVVTSLRVLLQRREKLAAVVWALSVGETDFAKAGWGPWGGVGWLSNSCNGGMMG